MHVVHAGGHTAGLAEPADELGQGAVGGCHMEVHQPC